MVAQAVQHVEQLLDVGKMQAGSWLVEDVKSLAGVAFGQFAGQLDPLRLAAGQRRRALSQLDVGEADVDQGLQLAGNGRHGIEELAGFLDGHVEHLGDALALVLHFQGFAVVALALAHVARHVDVRQEVHLHLDHAVALAGLAAAALDVEAEAARAVAARARLGHAGEQLADRGEQSGVGGRIRARRATDGALVDIDHLVQMLQAIEAVVGRCLECRGAVEGGRRQGEQGVVDQRRFARAGYAGDASKQAKRYFQVDVAQVVAARALEFELLLLVAWCAVGRVADLLAAGEVLAGQRVWVGHDLFRCAFGDDAAAMDAGAGADIHHIVRQSDGIFVVLDNDDRVAQVAQVGEGAQQAFVVALVQADGRLVQDIHHADQARADLAGQADALRLAAGQGVGAAIQSQVVEADIDQELQALADFLEDLVGDLAAAASQSQAAKVVASLTHRQGCDGWQCALAHPDMACLAAQAGAAAVRAGLGAEELGEFFPHGLRFGLAVAPLEVGNDALEGVGAFDDVAAVVEVAEFDILRAAAEQDDFLVLSAQIVERLLQAEAIVRGE